MSDLSPRLSLPYLLPAQAQKHVTHNDALRHLDAVVQLVVQRVDAQTPPVDPAVGAAYALGPSPSAAWAGQAHTLAIWQGGAWLFVPPELGWHLWDLNSHQMRVWAGSSWTAVPCHATPQIGVATSADATNRLAVAAPASLFTHAGQGHQMKLNKASPPDTASLLLQTGFSGRAEMGLLGNDAFGVKLSSDGSNWEEALRLSASGGPRLELLQSSGSGDLLRAEAGGSTAMRLTAAGDGLCAGSWQSGGADYAEFFEWADGNPDHADRRGLSVVLEGAKIRPARPTETPIGVVSATPAMVGEADLEEWPGTYQRDTFGARLFDTLPDGSRAARISPDFDPDQTYVPRSQRPEWAMVGLLGKLVLCADQPTDPRWHKMADLTQGLERWLLR